MEQAVQDLAQRCQNLVATRENGMLRPRVIVALAGIPGSGKTTLASLVAAYLNSLEPEKGIRSHYKTVVVGMDGFHLHRSELDEEGKRRRGAPFTFDAAGVVALCEKLKTSTYRNLPDITCPSFDHAVKDPVPDGIVIPRHANIIILEGLYLLLQDEPWRRIAKFVDETWFLDTDEEIARPRLAARHLAAGICRSIEDGFARADDNDLPNGKYLTSHGMSPTVVINGQSWTVREEDVPMLNGEEERPI